MKKYLFIILTILFVSCNRNVEDSRKMVMAYFDKTLVKPSSLEIISEKYKESENGKTIYWTIEYNSEDEYGIVSRNTLKCNTFYGLELKITEPTYEVYKIESLRDYLK